MKSKLIFLCVVLWFQTVSAISVEFIKNELIRNDWIETVEENTKKFGQTENLAFFTKEIQTEGFGLKKLVSVIDGKSGLIWFGPETKLIYIGKQSIRGVGYFSLAGSLHILGKSFSLENEIDQEKEFTPIVKILESSFQKNPFFWSTSCVIPHHFEQLKQVQGSKVQDIEQRSAGGLIITLRVESGEVFKVPLYFDHSSDTCSSENELKTARASEKPYPSGFFGWKRGQPSGEFDFEFDENLDKELAKIIESNK